MKWAGGAAPEISNTQTNSPFVVLAVADIVQRVLGVEAQRAPDAVR
jgi:hypothetical protein